MIIHTTFSQQPAFQDDSGCGAVDVGMLHPSAALATAAQARKFRSGFDRGGVFVGALHRASGARAKCRGELVGANAQRARGAVGVARAADDQQVGLVLLQQPLDRRPVYPMVADANRAAGGCCITDGVAGGDTNATQAEIKCQDDARSRLTHVRR
jgi:hypothetical protein